MVNGGVLYPPRLTPTDMPVGTRVISEPTSLVLRDMMRDVVTIGTGKKANVPGYDVIGKTGSAKSLRVADMTMTRSSHPFWALFPIPIRVMRFW